ncbi:hypothetical protein GuL6_096 [Buttiauxella phage vB_ButM_GuL6]|nr:hypothetical protein GuL6_096 [Buttiauxella phage vB_ButM_GuL6]
MNITKELEGKVINLVDVARFEKLANGGESLGDAVALFERLRVKRVVDGWVVALPVADSWDIAICLVNVEVELCFNEENN